MEVAPSNLRDASVSSSTGTSSNSASAHGRDIPSRNETVKKPTATTFHRREIPVDLAAEHIAETLVRSNPSMDPVTASTIAKQILSREKYETKAAEPKEPLNEPDNRLNIQA